MNSNRTVVDLNKVAYANLEWKERFTGICRSKKPTKPTVNGEDVSDPTVFAPEVQKANGETWPRESLLARAQRRKLLDTWEPQLVLQLCNSHSLTYTGAKALTIWKEWNRRVFSKTKKGK